MATTTNPPIKSEPGQAGGTNLIINYLPQNMTDKEFYHLFSLVGPVASARVIRDKQTGYRLVLTTLLLIVFTCPPGQLCISLFFLLSSVVITSELDFEKRCREHFSSDLDEISFDEAAPWTNSL